MIMDNLIKSKALDYYYSNSSRNNRVGNISGLKMQKFLYFYNAFSYLDSEEYTDDYLFAYPQGPVYHDVIKLYDVTRNTPHIIRILKENSSDELFTLNDEIAKTALNLVDRFNDDELSLITHNFKIWQEKEKLYSELKMNSDFTFKELSEQDLVFLKMLKQNFSDTFLSNYSSYYSENNSYLVEKANEDEIIRMLGGQSELTRINSESNPIYIYLEEGELVVD